jgi:hypothetical protein
MNNKIKIIFGLFLVCFFFSASQSSAYITSNAPGSNVASVNFGVLQYLLNNSVVKNILSQQGIGSSLLSGLSLPNLNLNLINTKDLSSKDITGSIKAVASLAINLFLIVIQTAGGILKALLPSLSK